MPDYSSFGETTARQLADFESRKTLEMGMVLGITDREDQRLRRVAGGVMENIISTLRDARRTKDREDRLSSLGMSKQLAAAAISELLPPLSENHNARERQQRAETETALVRVIASIIPAVEICVRPPLPPPEPRRSFGQGKARKRKV